MLRRTITGVVFLDEASFCIMSMRAEAPLMLSSSCRVEPSSGAAAVASVELHVR